MTRQLSELSRKEMDVFFKITSLKPINPHNAPNAIERNALLKFIHGEKEVFTRISKDKFFYMAPLKVKKPCLKCHKTQNYKVGDIIGGISIYIPYKSTVPYISLFAGHIVIGLIGIILIIVYNRKLFSAYEKIKYQASHDSLTGLFNRMNLEKKFEEELRRARRIGYPLSVIMCDIDFFKKYNDTYGHQAGDKVLKKVADIIRNSIKRVSDFCARYGGEEFIIILPNTDTQGAIKISKNIRKNLEDANIEHKSSSFKKVTLSCGIVTITNYENISIEQIIKRADEALYLAKRKGRNRIEIFNFP